MTYEAVVLVDEENRVLGTMPKMDVHGEITPLHRGFSCYIFRTSDRRLLLQQRSAKKKTWPLVWSNSCCGHPTLAESTVDAARRRIKYELGLEPTFLQEVIGYRYCCSKDGIMENEICPILAATVETEPVAHPDEVHAITWTTWDGFLESIERDPDRYSHWCIEQARILDKTAAWRRFIHVE